MRRALLAALLASFVVAAPIFAAVPAAAAGDDAGNQAGPPARWAKTVGGSRDDKLARGVTVDGGYLVVGWSNSSSGDGKHDGYVAMLDDAGQTKWERTYGGPGEDRFYDVVNVDDGYLLAGMSTDTTDGTWNGWVVKLGTNGTEQWQRTYGDGVPSAFWSLARSGDRIYVGGWQKESGRAATWAMELKPNGKEVWSDTYHTVRSGTDEYVNSVFAADDGQLILTGSILRGISDPADALVLKLGDDGDLKWHRTYGGTDYDRIYDAVTASDGGYVLAGRTSSHGPGNQDGWMLKIDDSGNEKWQRTFGTAKQDAFFGVHNDPDGGYVVSGEQHVRGSSGADGWVVKTDDRGRKQWGESYGKKYWDKFWPVIEGHGGGYLAIGESTSYGTSRDGWVVRIGGPSVAAIEDADANRSGTTVTLADSPVRAVTLADSNVSGVLSVAEQADPAALSPPGDPLYAVTTDGPAAARNVSATVEFAVHTDAVEANLSDLRVAERTDGNWSVLPTTVVSESNGTAILSANTSVGATLAVTSVPAPTASIDLGDSVLVGESADLSAAGSTAENATVARYEWTVGDRTLSGETASVSFDTPGKRTVELTVVDSQGITDNATATLVVNDRPEVSVETTDAVQVGKAGTFTADVTDEVGDVTVTWRFDGGSVTGRSVEHSFGSPGTETVTVVVEDEYGATVTKDVQVRVRSQSDAGTGTDRTAETTAGGTTTGDTGSGVPGFGVGVALVALAGAALLATRLE